jgi:hypothetical protein
MATKTDVLVDDAIDPTTEAEPVPAKKPRTPRTPKATDLLVFVEDGQVSTLAENVNLIVFNFDRLATAPAPEVEQAFWAACQIKDENLRIQTAKRIAPILNTPRG